MQGSWIMAVLVGMPAVVAGILGLRLWRMKRIIRQISTELGKTRQEGYDRPLRIPLMDGALEEMAAELNKNLAYQKALKLETEHTRLQMKQAVSDIAHDLRTPLTVIKGNLQMLGMEPLSDRGRQYLSICGHRAEGLKIMVDEFFELSLLESGDVVMHPEKIELAEFLTELVLEHEVMIRKFGLTPEFQLRPVYLVIDRRVLARVMGNLLQNLYKYADQAFSILTEEIVREEEGEKQIRIMVGNRMQPGVEADLAHLFDRTYRADRTGPAGSAGLGLYIVRLLVEKTGGRIEAFLRDGWLYFCMEWKTE